jgi:hypothetical protein
LVDSYGFKPDGLIKKTLNIKYKSVNHHIVSYYNLSDVKEGKYRRPNFDSRFDDLHVRQELLDQPFKASVVEPDELDPFRDLQQPSSNLAVHSSPQPPLGVHVTNNPMVSHNNHATITSSYAMHTQPHTSMAPPSYDFQQVTSFPVQSPSQYMQSQSQPNYYQPLVDSPQMMNNTQIMGGNPQVMSNMSMGNNPQNMDRQDSKHGIIDNSTGPLAFSSTLLPISTAADHSGIRASAGMTNNLPVEFHNPAALHMINGHQNYSEYDQNYYFSHAPSTSSMAHLPSAKRRLTAPAVIMPSVSNYTPQLAHVFATPSGSYQDMYRSTPSMLSEHGSIHS